MEMIARGIQNLIWKYKSTSSYNAFHHARRTSSSHLVYVDVQYQIRKLNGSNILLLLNDL